MIFGTLFVCSCADSVEEPAMEMVSVPIKFAAEDIVTKRPMPFDPEFENLIYDIWVIQYSERGVILTCEHYRSDVQQGNTEVSLTASFLKARNCTVCFLVNAGAIGGREKAGSVGVLPDDWVWPDNLPKYKETFVDVSGNSDADTPGDAMNKILMNGYYIGDVNAQTNISASLGRMMCRINLIVENQIGADVVSMKTWLDYVSKSSYLYPDVVDPLPDNIYFRNQDGTAFETFSDTINGTTEAPALKNGDSKELFYYLTPNICNGSRNATVLHINAVLADGTELEGSMLLGTDAPGHEGRDYILYPNDFYTFTVTLTTAVSASALPPLKISRR